MGTRPASLASRGAVVVAGGVAVVLVAVAVLLFVRPWQRPAAGAAGAGPDSLDVSATSCATRWSPGPAGRQGYLVHNTGRLPLRVTLLDASSGAVYGQIWLLAAGTTRPLEVTVPGGSYRWRCVPVRGTAAVSPVRPVRGAGGRGARPLRPVSSAEITAAVDAYRREVSRGLGRLVPDTRRLRAAVDAGRLLVARDRWLTAHLDYARLGAAYGTFGGLDGVIDGRPDGLARGSRDPHFTGFLRLEYGLWHGQPAAQLRPVARRLDRAVRKLARAFPTMATNPGDLPLRAHEILEDTLQFELTGDTDQGSHTNLATASANLAGTEMVCAALAPALRSRDVVLLRRIQDRLRALDRELAGYHRRSGWVGLDRLGHARRQRLNADVGAVLEDLALVPGILQMPPAIVPP